LILESEGCGITTTSLSTKTKEQKQCPAATGKTRTPRFTGENAEISLDDFFCGVICRERIR
jgi:hypothetical protein